MPPLEGFQPSPNTSVTGLVFRVLRRQNLESGPCFLAAEAIVSLGTTREEDELCCCAAMSCIELILSPGIAVCVVDKAW